MPAIWAHQLWSRRLADAFLPYDAPRKTAGETPARQKILWGKLWI
jgi:hypothetical protein